MHRAHTAPAETPRDRRPDTRAGRFRRALRQTALPIAGRLLLAFLGLTAVWTGLGLLLTGPLAGGPVDVLDRHVAQWLVERRTPQLDELSQAGSLLAETLVKVIVTAVIAVVLLAVLRSWREPFLVAFALILEASVFITVTWLVGRPRPDVPALEEVSVDTSFPSGHVAAAAAYAAIAIVIFEHTRRVWIRAVTVAVVIAVPIVVGLSRMYRGVHYLTDTIGGLVLGAVCVLVVYLIARPGRLRSTPDQR
ncbi:MAG TPA: phosphatase PAP2 family protein [Nakamurella sp.]